MSSGSPSSFVVSRIIGTIASSGGTTLSSLTLPPSSLSPGAGLRAGTPCLDRRSADARTAGASCPCASAAPSRGLQCAHCFVDLSQGGERGVRIAHSPALVLVRLQGLDHRLQRPRERGNVGVGLRLECPVAPAAPWRAHVHVRPPLAHLPQHLPRAHRPTPSSVYRIVGMPAFSARSAVMVAPREPFLMNARHT